MYQSALIFSKYKLRLAEAFLLPDSYKRFGDGHCGRRRILSRA